MLHLAWDILYSLFGNTEKYDNLTGSVIAIVLFLIGLIATFSIYGIYLVDTNLDKNPGKKSERLKIIKQKNPLFGGFFCFG